MKVIGIGASAGGMEAIIEFLKYLPSHTGAAFVLVQHLSMDHKSIMDEILSRYTQMPVITVNESMTPMPNHFYVNAPKKNLTFQHGMLLTRERGASVLLNLPIDEFFHSLGTALEKEAIAIIFSGSGTDGSKGCRTIKEKGGLIFVQDEESAVFDGMPKSVIDLEIADIVKPPKEIANILTEVLKKQLSTEGAQQEADLFTLENENKDWFSRILQYISRVRKVDFKTYREPTLIRRMNNRMLLQGINNLSDYYNFLTDNHEETNALCKDFFIGVTAFFRDPKAFQELESKIIPRIVKASDSSHPIRLWIAACSTGEEAYTVAILLDSYLKQNRIKREYKIFASDVNKQAIRIASRGSYPYNIVSDIPENLLVEYFRRDLGNYRIKQEIRDKMLFAVHNALSDPPFIQMDFISCRNFLIYLKTSTQRKLLTTFNFALNPHGYMFLGPSETIGELKSVFQPIIKKWNIYQNTNDNIMLPRRSSAFNEVKIENDNYEITPISVKSFEIPSYIADDFEDRIDPFTRHLAINFVPLSIFFNEKLEMIYSNEEVDRVFRLNKDYEDRNIHKIFQKDIAETLEEGFQKVIDTKNSYIQYDFSFTSPEGEKNKANLVFQKERIEEIEEPLFLLKIELKKDQSNKNHQFEVLRKQKLFDEKRNHLQKVLLAAERKTEELVGEQENTNEELQTSNRELLAYNEELQSTNEELQSVNEELYTVNNELRLKNDQLIAASNDLDNILKSTNIGIIFLDNQFKIRRFTPATQEQFALIGNDIGRVITNFSHAFKNINIGEICKQVYHTLEVYEEEITDQNDRHYLLRVLPYRTEDDVIEGVVIYFLNVTELVAVRNKLKSLANKYDSLFKYSEDIIIELKENGKIVRINKNWADQSAKELEGAFISGMLSKRDAKKIKVTLERTLEEKKSNEINKLHVRGKYYKVCFLPLKTSLYPSNGSLREAVLIFQDISSQQERFNQLDTTVKRYKEFMDKVPYQIMLVERSGKVKYVNKLLYTNKTKKSIVGTNVTDYLSEEDARLYLQSLDDIFEGKPFRQIGFSYRTTTGEAREFQVIATPVVIDKHVQLAAVVNQDVFKEIL